MVQLKLIIPVSDTLRDAVTQATHFIDVELRSLVLSVYSGQTLVLKELRDHFPKDASDVERDQDDELHEHDDRAHGDGGAVVADAAGCKA
jgi:hypothetical protein